MRRTIAAPPVEPSHQEAHATNACSNGGAQRVELSDPPAVITKYWCVVDAIGHAKPIITDGKRVSSGHMGRPSDVVD
jgi:hypothetical protein